MSKRPRLLFYCQHSLGMGHLIRSFAIADGLANHFEEVFLNGGPLPEGQRSPEKVEIINLPPLGFDSEMQLLSRDDNHTVAQAQRLRLEIMRNALRSVKPDVLLIELFPFGRKKFAKELITLLEDARALSAPPVVVCSLRDILVERNQHHDELACYRVNRYFDVILVHSDARFARLEESFHPCSPLKVPVHYTGFVAREQEEDAKPKTREPRIVVSAGGGLVGETLLRTAIQAYEFLPAADKPELRLIGGPFIPEQSWQGLEEVARGKQGISLIRSVPDLGVELRSAVASISQCGYNTAMDILRSRVPALVVPFSGEKQDEQMNRARRLERLGALRVLEQDRLNAQTLAAEMDALLRFQPSPIQLDMNGVVSTAQLIKDLLPRKQKGSSNGLVKRHAAIPDWLIPVHEKLDSSSHPVSLFFRDDDCGWGDDRQLLLLDIFADFDVPVDLATIPAALNSAFAQKLSRRMAAHPERLRIHQHGYAHLNHEAAGKKCEFGPARDYQSQRSDIENGQRRLAELLETQPDPIFTPPWNRCTAVTARCLAELGFQVLSRHSDAVPFEAAGVCEMPISVDWFAHYKKVRLDRMEWGKLLAAKLENEAPVGIMLHHGVMDAEEMLGLAQLLSVLARHANAKCQTMRALAAAEITNLFV
ncbi:MAG TPA: glycosyltransferase [Candidatus Angelobacter sp.]|nr:glycosyltransferase [Candidatus Angelobacter sp.]